MDIISYLLGKKASGGGGTVNLESKEVTITTNTTTEVTPSEGYDGLSKVTVTTNVSSGGDLDWTDLGYSSTPQTIINSYNYANYIKNNWVENTSKLSDFKEVIIAPMLSFGNRTSLSNTSSYCMSLTEIPLWDTSNITDISNLFNNCTSLKYVPLLNTGSVTTFYNSFINCGTIKEIPSFNTGNVTTFRNAFSGCVELTTLPVLDTSKATTMQNMVSNCPKLTNESLNNILKMCINTTSAYTRAKTLRELGIALYQYPNEKIEALPDYQNFLDAGWTIS